MAPRLRPEKTSHLEWIKEHVDGYKEALAKGTVEPWCANMIHEYFSTYHWSIPDDVEPTPGATYTEPVNKEGLDDKNAIMDKKKKESVSQIICLLSSHLYSHRHCFIFFSGIMVTARRKSLKICW
jgi:hypothetical protein